jgi:hypothetical protein
MDRIEEIVMDLRVDNTRMEERVINLERYIVKDLKDALDANSIKIEARFKWMIGLFIAFMGIAIGVPLAI